MHVEINRMAPVKIFRGSLSKHLSRITNYYLCSAFIGVNNAFDTGQLVYCILMNAKSVTWNLSFNMKTLTNNLSDLNVPRSPFYIQLIPLMNGSLCRVKCESFKNKACACIIYAFSHFDF